jgi:hypothetical protein
MPKDTNGFARLFADAQKQALSALKEAQELSARAAELAVGLIQEDPTRGISSNLATPREMVEESFAFAGKVLELQKAYALRLVEVLNAGTAKVGDAAAAAAAKAKESASAPGS